MKIETRARTVKDTVYIAYDGTEFQDEVACQHHEWLTDATAVYIVTSRGQRADANEIYSTHDLAVAAVGDSETHYITKVYLDERFWEAEMNPDKLQDARKFFYEHEGYMAADLKALVYYWNFHGK